MKIVFRCDPALIDTIPRPVPAREALPDWLKTMPANMFSELHGQEVTVQMSNGHATLIGTVDTWLDHKLAAKEAYDASAKKVKPTAGASRHSTSLSPNADWI